MPNYSLVMNSKFQPFSFERYIQPLQIYGQAYREQEDALAELDTKASVWEGMANEQTDPKAYAQYKKFADDLRAQADVLATEGLNPSSRQAMLNLRGRYAKEIIPIEQAFNKRQADIQAQQKAMLQDPTHFFDRRAAELSLDEYLGNSNLDVLSNQYSGSLLMQQVGQVAQAYKNNLTKEGAIEKLGLPHQYKQMFQYGASVDEVFAAMARDPQASPILLKMVDDVMAASGIRNWSSMKGDWANNELYKRAEAYAMQGLYNTIGTTKTEHFTDSYNMQNASAAIKRRGQGTDRNMIDPINLYNKVRDERRDFWGKKGFIVNKDNAHILGDKGKDALNSYNRARVAAKKRGWSDARLEDYLKDFSSEEPHALGIISKEEARNGLFFFEDLQKMNKESGEDLTILQLPGEDSELNPTNTVNIEAVSKLLSTNFDRTIHSQTAYRYQIGKEDSEDVLGTILSDYGQGKYVDIMKYDAESQKYKNSGTLKRANLSDYRINNIQVSDAGNIVEFLDKDDNTVIIRLPNSRNVTRLNTAINNISKLQNKMASLDPSSADYALLNEVLGEQEAALYQIISDSYRKNKSKNQEFKSNSTE